MIHKLQPQNSMKKAAMKQKKKKTSHLRGRIISLTEMIQLILKYSEVHTDLTFVNILTYSLEFRKVTERVTKPSTVEDGAYLEIETVIIREEKIPDWRLHTKSQWLILNGLRQSLS